MEKENIGIDYGMGMSNIDTETGIRYGVIHSGEVLQAWADSSEAIYPECDCEDYCECENDPEGFSFIAEGYKAFQFGDDCDIFIEKSPYYTVCQFCSPCAPGAGYIMQTRKNGIKAYCFGHDWFEDEKAPYPVYDVITGKEIKA